MSAAIDRETLHRWMRQVIKECRRGIALGQSPFAAAIYAADGKQISITHNVVRKTHRPSQHGEVTAIDAACQSLGQLHLPVNAWLISTGEPCPMCAATAAVAGIRNIAFGAARETVKSAGYQSLGLGCQEFFDTTGIAATVVGKIEVNQCSQLLLENCKT